MSDDQRDWVSKNEVAFLVLKYLSSQKFCPDSYQCFKREAVFLTSKLGGADKAEVDKKLAHVKGLQHILCEYAKLRKKEKLREEVFALYKESCCKEEINDFFDYLELKRRVSTIENPTEIRVVEGDVLGEAIIGKRGTVLSGKSSKENKSGKSNRSTPKNKVQNENSIPIQNGYCHSSEHLLGQVQREGAGRKRQKLTRGAAIHMPRDPLTETHKNSGTAGTDSRYSMPAHFPEEAFKGDEIVDTNFILEGIAERLSSCKQFPEQLANTINMMRAEQVTHAQQETLAKQNVVAEPQHDVLLQQQKQSGGVNQSWQNKLTGDIEVSKNGEQEELKVAPAYIEKATEDALKHCPIKDVLSTIFGDIAEDAKEEDPFDLPSGPVLDPKNNFETKTASLGPSSVCNKSNDEGQQRISLSCLNPRGELKSSSVNTQDTKTNNNERKKIETKTLEANEDINGLSASDLEIEKDELWRDSNNTEPMIDTFSHHEAQPICEFYVDEDSPIAWSESSSAQLSSSSETEKEFVHVWSSDED
eukprot:Nk52_evm86s914 gene=Nk52_evmTU86s914